MGKRVFEDVDEKTFQYIKRCKNENGLIDCHKLFRKISVGDTIIFSYKNVDGMNSPRTVLNFYNAINQWTSSDLRFNINPINGSTIFLIFTQ